MKDFKDSHACHDCNIKMGGKAPKGQVGITVMVGTCPYCGAKGVTLVTVLVPCAELKAMQAELSALRAEIENAPVVYSWKDQEDWRKPSDVTDCDFDWSARLVRIKKIGEKS